MDDDFEGAPARATPVPWDERPPAPRVPGARKKRIRLAAIALGAAAGVFLFYRFVLAPKVSLTIRSGAWTGCDGKYVISGRASRQTTISAFGTTAPTTSEGEFSIAIDRDKIAGAKEIDLELDPGGTVTHPIAPPPPGIQRAHVSGAEFDDVAVSVGEHRLPLDDHTEAPATGHHARVVLDACTLSPATIDRGFFQVAIETSRVVVDVDLEAYYALADGDRVSDRAAARFEVPGTRITIVVAGDVKLAAPYARWARVAEQPVAGAPLPKDVAEPRPIAVFEGGVLDRQHLRGKAIAAAPYVALIARDNENVGSCGPYGAPGKPPVYATRYAHSAKVAAYEALTGRLLDARTLRGSVPACPDVVRARSYHDESTAQSIDGTQPDTQAWLDDLSRRAP